MSRLALAVASGGLSLALLGTGVPAGAAPSEPGITEQPVLGSAPAASPEHHGEVPPQLRRQGRWLVDPQGRVVIVHGLNLVYKHQPYVPPATPEGFTVRDARWFKRHGFNGARLGTLWAGLTPARPRRRRPDVRRPLAAHHRPAGLAEDLDAVRLPPGHVA